MTTIVVVDDSEIELDLFTSMLKEAGYDCHGVSDPELALTAIIDRKPDFILLDYSMPHKNGIELCKELKVNPLTRNIPVMFLSAETDPDNIIATMHLGCVDYIRKPVNCEYLVDVLTRHEVMQKFKDAWAPAKVEAERILRKYDRRHRDV